MVTVYSDWYIISPPPHTTSPFSPSWISLLVSVDVQHRVYLLSSHAAAGLYAFVIIKRDGPPPRQSLRADSHSMCILCVAISCSCDMWNQQTRELTGARTTSHKHSNKDPNTKRTHSMLQRQRPESSTLTLTWRAIKYKVHKLHQRCILCDKWLHSFMRCNYYV